MPRGDDRFIIRLPDGWRDAIKVRATQNRRSMNQEILIALGSAFGLAAGDQPASTTPAAEDDKAALQGGSI